MKEVYRELDSAAECDIRLFWKLVKQRKKRTTRTYPEIHDDNGNVYNDPKSIAEAFAKHYEHIYTPSENDIFDKQFHQDIEDTYKQIESHCSKTSGGIPGGPIVFDDIFPIINKLKRRKAPGPDQITYEHIIFGGNRLTSCIIKLFNSIISQGKIPSAWKQGLIVPLYKGGDKPKTSPNSYRPVTLLPCFLKIFESVLNDRISKFILHNHSFPNKQQQGFQEKLGCLTASFNLKETINYNLEQGSHVYVGFLDSSKAFDTVWRHGLLYKLHKLGVNGKCWSIINDCHLNTSSSVVVNQTQSRWFNVLQGVRQGGVLSSFLYLVFINELIDTLEHCSTCTKLLNVASNCPTLADDISLIGLTPISLQSMLNIANEYLKKMAIQIQR